MSEYPEERILIQMLWERFHKDWLKTGEIAQYDNVSVQTARRRYNIQNGGMSICTLAHLKCMKARGKTSCRY